MPHLAGSQIRALDSRQSRSSIYDCAPHQNPFQNPRETTPHAVSATLMQFHFAATWQHYDTDPICDFRSQTMLRAKLSVIVLSGSIFALIANAIAPVAKGDISIHCTWAESTITGMGSIKLWWGGDYDCSGATFVSVIGQ